MNRPRSAIVATRIFEPEGAAAAYRLGNLVRALERRGYSTTVLTTRSPGAKKSSGRVRRWPVLRDKSGAVRGYVQYASFDVPLLFRLLFGKRADIVIAEPPPTTGFVTRLACRVRRVPYAYFSADVTSAAVSKIGVHPVIVMLVRWLESVTLRGASLVLAISDGVKDEVLGLGAHPDRVTVVGTGIDTDVFSFEGRVIDEGHPYFIYAGTMSEFQGAGVFVEAFAQLSVRHPTAKLIMFGGGVEVDAIKETARPLGDRVRFPGQVNAEEVASWLRGAAASLSSIRPGLGYDFAFPTKTLASISCGVPVIYAGAGPLGSIVSSNQLGWSTEWDATAVASAMEQALRSHEQSRSRRLADWAESHYSMRTVADRAVLALDELLHE